MTQVTFVMFAVLAMNVPILFMIERVNAPGMNVEIQVTLVTFNVSAMYVAFMAGVSTCASRRGSQRCWPFGLEDSSVRVLPVF